MSYQYAPARPLTREERAEINLTNTQAELVALILEAAYEAEAAPQPTHVEELGHKGRSYRGR